jgi:hypothetical protein
MLPPLNIAQKAMAGRGKWGSCAEVPAFFALLASYSSQTVSQLSREGLHIVARFIMKLLSIYFMII